MTEPEKNNTYLIVSDIHADIKALDTIIEIIGHPEFIKRYGSINKIINLGDMIERGYHPVEVIERLIKLGKTISLKSIMGNHDESFLYNWPVSGNDMVSIIAHEELKSTASTGNKCMQSCLNFLKNQPPFYIDHEENILAVHGGPINPETIVPPGLDNYEKWLYQMTWQRISEKKHEYMDSSGYHYLPENAFIHAGNCLDNGFLIFCGHQHTEAAYRHTGMKIESISEKHMRVSIEKIGGHVINAKELKIEKHMNYLIRLGIAGPIGYYKWLGWDKTHFGLLWKKQGMQRVCLFESQMEY